MLGFWVAILSVVSREAMRQSVRESVPPKTIEVNLKAFDVGYERGLEVVRVSSEMQGAAGDDMHLSTTVRLVRE
jgi:Pyruvate/2-oxoacid:ferredoxin oxidoreductase gamma subunit